MGRYILVLSQGIEWLEAHWIRNDAPREEVYHPTKKVLRRISEVIKRIDDHAPSVEAGFFKGWNGAVQSFSLAWDVIGHSNGVDAQTTQLVSHVIIYESCIQPLIEIYFDFDLSQFRYHIPPVRDSQDVIVPEHDLLVVRMNKLSDATGRPPSFSFKARYGAKRTFADAAPGSEHDARIPVGH